MLKTSKTPRIDGIPAEIFKNSPEETAGIPYPLIKTIWEQKISSDKNENL